MKLTYPKGNIVRFDFDLSKADNPNNISFTVDPNAAYGTAIDKNGSQSIGIICRYRVFSVNSSNEEVLGYVRETKSTIFEFGTKETDLSILTKFCSDAFLNVELDFQDRLKLSYNIFGRTRPSFDKLGQSLLQQLTDANFYK